MHLQNYRPSFNFYGRAHHDGSRLWLCFGQWSMHKQNQCARSRFDQLMNDWYWGWSPGLLSYPTRKPNHLRDQMLSIEVTTTFQFVHNHTMTAELIKLSNAHQFSAMVSYSNSSHPQRSDILILLCTNVLDSCLF